LQHIETFSYKPTEKQLLFHNSTADELLYGGAAGGGKSTAAVADAFVKCMATAGVCAYLFRRTYPELEDTLIATAKRLIPECAGKYIAAAHEYRLVNGSVMRFRHLQYDADVTAYQGAEMQYLYIDELTHFPRAVYDYLKTRVRATVGQRVKPLIRCTSNPGGIGHGWVRQYFVDSCKDGGTREVQVYSAELGRAQTRRVQYIPARALDNPHLAREYVFELEQKPKKLREALLLGRWDAFEGQAFTEWRDEPEHYGDGIGTHVVAPFEIPAEWPAWCSFDFGYAKPFSVGWWAVSPGGRVYRTAEWYGCTGTADEGIKIDPAAIARGILEREAERGQAGRFVRVADPSIFDESRGMSVARAMANEGVSFLPGDNKRLPGKMQMHYRLRMGPDGKPGLQVFQTCRQFIRTVPALAYSAVKPEDIDTSAEDHIYDETRYFLMANPVGQAVKQVPDLNGWRPPALDPFAKNARAAMPWR
jgi:hypothetical protein